MIAIRYMMLVVGVLCLLLLPVRSAEGSSIKAPNPVPLKIGYFDISWLERHKPGISYLMMGSEQGWNLFNERAGEIHKRPVFEIEKFKEELKQEYNHSPAVVSHVRPTTPYDLQRQALAKTINELAKDYSLDLVIPLSSIGVGKENILKSGVDVTPDFAEKLNLPYP